MIADDIARMLYDLRQEIYDRKASYAEPRMVIYIDNETWRKMISEINGPVSPAAMGLYESKGKELLGCPIHRVLTDGHGIKVYENTTE
jgi:putative sterol carrier protein